MVLVALSLDMVPNVNIKQPGAIITVMWSRCLLETFSQSNRWCFNFPLSKNFYPSFDSWYLCILKQNMRSLRLQNNRSHRVTKSVQPNVSKFYCTVRTPKLGAFRAGSLINKRQPALWAQKNRSAWILASRDINLHNFLSPITPLYR